MDWEEMRENLERDMRNMNVSGNEDEYNDREEYEDENDDSMKREAIEKSKKAQKIILKVAKLEKALKQEKNPIKRMTAKFKLYQLKAELQQAIDLALSKAEFETRRDYLKTNRQYSDRNDIQEIARLTSMKKILENRLYADSEYDIQSSNFLYDRNIIEQQGGIDHILQQLREDKSPSSQETIRRIEEMMEARAELKDVKSQLKQTRKSLNNSKKRYNKDNREIDKQEMAMTVTSKLNIFQKIGNAFKAGMTMLQENSQMRTEFKRLREERRQRDQTARNVRDNTIEEAKNAYKSELEAIRKQREELDAREKAVREEYLGEQARAREGYKMNRIIHKGYEKYQGDNAKTEHATRSAKAYRQELHNMTGGVVPTVKSTNNQNDGTKNQEEKMHDDEEQL